MTTDQPARTPEEMRGEEQAARERAHALIGSEAVFMNDGGGRVFSAHALSALQDRLTANELAHAREVEALRDLERRLREDGAAASRLYLEQAARADAAEAELATLRARIEAAAREDDATVAEIRWSSRLLEDRASCHVFSILDATRAANAGLREALERARPLLKFLTRGYCEGTDDGSPCTAAACIRANEAKAVLRMIEEPTK